MKIVHLVLFILSRTACVSSRSNNSSAIHTSSAELIKYIEHDYDKTMIPNISSGIPLDVKIDIYITSIEPIDQKNMRFTVQMYLRQYWRDDRLRFKLSNTSCTNFVSLHSSLISKVWVPDTYIENEVQKGVRSRALIIYFNGQILLSERVNIEAYCPMDLRTYPIDAQECSLKFQSYSYAACQLHYSWFYEGRGDSLRLSDTIELPNYDITSLNTLAETDNLKTERFSRLVAKFQFKHRITYALMRDYVPAAFIVVTSWLSFYIDPAASPARVSLAVVTVLSIATHLSSTFNYTSEVSYIKAIDWYVIGCFLFVFAALIEYGFIHRYGDQALKNNNDNLGAGHERHGRTVNQAMAEEELENSIEEQTTRSGHDLGYDNETIKGRMSQYLRDHSHNYISNYNTNPVHAKSGKSERQATFMARYPEIPCADAISRVAFPVLFLIFNAVYWFLLFFVMV